MARIPDERLEELGGRKKLSPRELQFMLFIWKHPDGVSSEEIYAHFPQARSTKSTTLANISEKGYLQNQQEGLHHIYTFTVTRAEYERAILRQQLKEMQREASLFGLISAFCGTEHLTEDQEKRIQELLKELENDSEAGKSMD